MFGYDTIINMFVIQADFGLSLKVKPTAPIVFTFTAFTKKQAKISIIIRSKFIFHFDQWVFGTSLGSTSGLFFGTVEKSPAK